MSSDEKLFDAEKRLETMPEQPGVYLMKDKTGKIVYIGKSINLRNRVKSYFSGADPRAFVRKLRKILGDIEVILTSNEREALILENNLIKAHKPRFNVLLKDDKDYLSLVLNTRAKWPRVVMARRPRGDGKKAGVKVFGPYHSARSARQTLGVLNRHFMLRTCPDSVLNNRARPCLQYQIKRCPAPCVFPVNGDEYGEHVKEATMFLEGKSRELKERLVERMMQASEDLEFEVAARLRDQIKAIERSVETTQNVDHITTIDQDAFGHYREGDRLSIQVLQVRRGRLESTRNFTFQDHEVSDEELFSSFLNLYYHDAPLIPHEVLLPLSLPDAEALGDVFGELRGSSVKVLAPKRGKKKDLVDGAARNARQSFVEKQAGEEQRADLLQKLQKRLKLRNFPTRMECFDISNFQGKQVVGSMVVFEDGESASAEYRHFKIKTVDGQDDFASMYEVLERRIKRALSGDWPMPDLIVVDGGKGQLGQAVALLEDQGVHNVDVISLAKGRVASDVTSESIEKSLERVFLPGRKNPIVLRQNSAELYLLQRIRDEAHRFAITFHRKTRSKATLKSSLDGIPGVGPSRRRALLKHFGSIKAVREASAEEIAQAPGVGLSLAQSIRAYLDGAGES